VDAASIRSAMTPDVDSIVDGIVECLQNFQPVFKEGTPEEQKEFIRLFVEGIELDAEKRVAVCRIKKFPAPSDLDAGKLSFKLVAGAGFEPATFGLCLPLQLSLPRTSSWSGLSLHPRLP